MPKTPTVSKEMRDLLSRIADQNEARRAARKQAAAPEVGIFFVYGGHIWVDGTPVNEAVLYGDLKIHDKGHDRFWAELQKTHVVPADVEYDEPPRGRVAYDTKTQTYRILLDSCLLKKDAIVKDIFRVMNLPPQPATEIGLDSHYRCPGCMSQPAE